MATTRNHLFMISAILVLIFMSLDSTAAQIGIFYGRNGDGLPPPTEVVAIFQRNQIKRMRIYEPYAPILEALRDSGIELTVNAPNDQLQRLTDQASAYAWVRDIIQKYPSVNFKHVVVGNEISPIRNQELVPFVFRAIQNIRGALNAAGLGRIAVTTAVEMEILDPSKSFPPSMGEFREEVKPYIQPILEFLVNTNAPLFANIYPYFAYINSGGVIPLDHALLNPGGGINTPDGPYDNQYYALLDTLYAAVEKMEISSLHYQSGGISHLEIKVGESGWSSSSVGNPAEAVAAASAEAAAEALAANQTGGAANLRNAAEYVNNLIRVVKTGTPRRPNRTIETYIFAMFDENRKSGNPDERHFGIFNTNGTTKYSIDFY